MTDTIEQGNPTSPTCRWCGTAKVTHVKALVCLTCDGTPVPHVKA